MWGGGRSEIIKIVGTSPLLFSTAFFVGSSPADSWASREVFHPLIHFLKLRYFESRREEIDPADSENRIPDTKFRLFVIADFP